MLSKRPPQSTTMETATRLVGKELLAKIKELKGASKSEIAKACGYSSTTVTGDKRCQFTAFYQAVAEANGFNFDNDTNSDGKGRPLSYTATVLTTGAILIGPRYVEDLGLNPGEKVAISTTGKKISLTPVSND